MAAAWSPAELEEIDAARELQIASRRADGTLRQWVPIWVVSAGGLVTCGPGTGVTPVGSVRYWPHAGPASASLA
jgi:Uncharacterized protein conserved in bacteria (DUF2255)